MTTRVSVENAASVKRVRHEHWLCEFPLTRSLGEGSSTETDSKMVARGRAGRASNQDEGRLGKMKALERMVGTLTHQRGWTYRY